MTVADITIELGSAPSGGCPCCDPAACFPQGYVSRAGRPHAVYFADWDHGARGTVELLISIGNWDRNSTSADRSAAAFRGRVSEGIARWTGFDAEMSLWRDVGMVGRLLSGDDAALEAEFARLAEAIAARDSRIREALAETASTSNTTLRRMHRKTGTFAARAASKQSAPD